MSVASVFAAAGGAYDGARRRLMPGGIFVNADQVAGATPALDRRYDEV
ncbi:MAG TPA: hypothetical protein VFR67_16590 [Pilimelia sp.]|nr:hypothetical protein [Pilimelia sp.]